MELKTPLYDCHVACGGKIVPFAGYLLPVQYEEGIIAEHMAVRTKAGLFDVSHMGEVLLSGPDALKNIQNLVTNNCENMVEGQVKYSPMCNEAGGVVDDLMVYKMGEERYMLVINAANRHKDVAWMKEHLTGSVQFEDVSDATAQIALQGPHALDILKKVTEDCYIPKKYYTFVEKGIVASTQCIISRTGYTGEDGFELYTKVEDAKVLWETLLKVGSDLGLIPCGLGARDTLRLEASMPLYGHEMDDEITPLEAGLTGYVKMDKEDFIGKSAIAHKGAPTRKRVGLKMKGRGIAREHFVVFSEGKEIGMTTSGTHCPYLGYAVAMALLDVNASEIGTEVEVDIRGKKISAEVIRLPFYKKKINPIGGK